MRRFILGSSLAGTLLFGLAFAISYLEPIWIEGAARHVLRLEVERQAGARIDALSGTRVATVAQQVLARTDADIAGMRAALRAELPQKVAQVVDDMLDPDCDCRRRLAATVDAGMRLHLRALEGMRGRLQAMIESTYAQVSARLLREWRIFTLSNATAFALLGAVTLARRGLARQLALPAIVIGGAVVVTGACYLFAQDWLHTIVFGSYVGLAYAGWLAAVALLLSDLAFNRARVVNGVLQAVGAAAPAC